MYEFNVWISMSFSHLSSIERWDFYQEYIQTVVELVKNKSEIASDDNQSIDTSFESCHEFLGEVSRLMNFTYFLRAIGLPYKMILISIFF